MSKETIVRIEFLIDMGRKEQPYVASTCFLDGNGSETNLPKVNPEHVGHVGDKIDAVRVTAFRQVD